ncbi:MAG: hypothetical protein JWR26_4064 [Pedosphaera sp.]|nr:hypothetical protein [Pedosphaera sp.]
MADAFAELDASIVEVTKARESILRGRSVQVFSGDERDRLKSVAYAWFQTHRPQVAAHPSKPDLQAVDAAYQTVMQATGRSAARTTYTRALKSAKDALVEVQSIVAMHPVAMAFPVVAVPSNQTPDAPPNFSPLAADPKMQTILIRRWEEVQQNLASKSNLSATVMMGGLLESLLLARINSSSNQTAVFTATTAPRDRQGKTLLLADWKLVKMVEVAHELAWITKSARDVGNVLRDFRNYIHPHKEYTDGVVISEDDAHMFWEVTKSISRQVLGSVGKTP